MKLNEYDIESLSKILEVIKVLLSDRANNDYRFTYYIPHGVSILEKIIEKNKEKIFHAAMSSALRFVSCKTGSDKSDAGKKK